MTSTEPRAEWHPGDPALDGNEYLLADSDYRAIITVARDYLRRKRSPWTARRVHIITASVVEVGLGPLDFGGEQGSLRLERKHGTWSVTQAQLWRVLT